MKTLRSCFLLIIALAAPTAVSAQRADPVYVEDRLNQLQQSITLLTGQIEQLQYKNQQLQQQMEKMQADYEFRLDQLEGKKGGAPRPPGASPTPPTAAHPPAAPNMATAPPAGGAQGEQLYHDAFKLLQDGDY